MLPVLLATTLSFGFYQDPGHARPEATLELLARVNETRLVALNPSTRPQLLVFSHRHGGAPTQVVVPAGGHLQYDFPHGTLNGLELELVARGEHGLRSSGELSLTGLVHGEFDLIWMETVDGSVHTWGQLPTGSALVPPQRDSDSGFLNLPAPSAPAAPHVPVITPIDKPKGDLPPRIEPEPLPPV
jgi:hypothetical protein